MGESRTAAKVGLFVLIGLVLCGGLYLYLGHLNPNTYFVRVAFTNTKGLVRQSLVRMQGVTIGEVQNIELDTSQRPLRPVVTLAIQKQFAIPGDSQFVVISGILITNPQVEIQPGKSPTALAQNETRILDGGEPTDALAAFSPELKQTVVKFNDSFDNLNRKFNAAYGKIDKILDQTQTLLATFNETAKSGKGLLGDPRLKSDLLATVGNFRDASNDVKGLTKRAQKELTALMQSSRGNIDNLTQKLGNLLTRIDGTIDDANTIVKRLTEQLTDPRVQQSLQETIELSRTTLARFTQIASDIHQLTGDPRLQNDLKQTLENIKGLTEESKQVVEKVNDLLGRIVGEDGKGLKTPSIKLPQVELVGNVSEQFNPTRLRLDVDARIKAGQNRFFDVGLYDLGQSTRLNLQSGTILSDSLTVRYGLYASRIGAGLEYTRDGIGFRADLWDTNRLRLDARAIFRVNSDASVWLGADGLFRRPVPLIGVQIKR